MLFNTFPTYLTYVVGEAYLDRSKFVPKVTFDDATLRNILTPEQWSVAIDGKDEDPRGGQYWDNRAAGQYNCIICDNYLFDNKDKIRHSAFAVFNQTYGVAEIWEKQNLRQYKIELRCQNCGAYLGISFFNSLKEHLNYYHYVVNSAPLKFIRNHTVPDPLPDDPYTLYGWSDEEEYTLWLPHEDDGYIEDD